MTDFDDELAQLRADVVLPDSDAEQRIAARLSRSIGTIGGGSAPPGPRALPWARPLQLATSFAVGGIVGASLYGALRAPRVERVYVERPSAVAQTSASSAAAAPSAAPTLGALREVPPQTPPLLPARAATSTPSTSASGDRSVSLAEQQALLDAARAAFAQGDHDATLKTLAMHSARFPKTALAEEREALQIKALAASDRLQQARTLAARFRARHPQSLLLPSIKDSVGAIP